MSEEQRRSFRMAAFGAYIEANGGDLSAAKISDIFLAGFDAGFDVGQAVRPPAPAWTTMTPESPGWYLRQPDGYEPYVYKFTSRNLELMARCDGCWLGPIPEPPE